MSYHPPSREDVKLAAGVLFLRLRFRFGGLLPTVQLISVLGSPS